MDTLAIVAVLLVVCFWLNRRLNRLEDLILEEFYEDDDDPERDDLPELGVRALGSVTALPTARACRLADADVAAATVTVTKPRIGQ